MDVISSHAPCALSLVVLTGSYDEQNMGTQLLAREALKAKQNQLKQQGKGNKPKRACPLTDEKINILYNRNVLGSHTPQFLLNTL
jgi:hypothetical protein